MKIPCAAVVLLSLCAPALCADVKQAMHIQLTINMRTAKAIGVKIPQSLLLRADRLID